MSLNAQAIMTPGGISDQLSRGLGGVAQAMQQSRQSNREHQLRMAELEARRIQREQELADRKAEKDGALRESLARQGFTSVGEMAEHVAKLNARETSRFEQALADRDRKLAEDEGYAIGLSQGDSVVPFNSFSPVPMSRPGFEIGRQKGFAARRMADAKIADLGEARGVASPPKPMSDLDRAKAAALISRALLMTDPADPIYPSLAAEYDRLLSPPPPSPRTTVKGTDMDTLTSILGVNPE